MENGSSGAKISREVIRPSRNRALKDSWAARGTKDREKII